MPRPFIWDVDEDQKIIDTSIFEKVEACAAQGLTKEQTAHALGRLRCRQVQRYRYGCQRPIPKGKGRR